jgi:hypothetical protein
MNKDCEKTTAHSQHILHGDSSYNINSKNESKAIRDT